MKSTLALLALVSGVAVSSSASADQSTGLTKYAGAMSQSGLDLSSTWKAVSVDLTGARKGRLLVVHASASQSGAAMGVYLRVRVNGVELEPGELRANCPVGNCLVSGTFFLDMAQAEAAHPGVFYNTLPLEVEARSYASVYGGNSGKISLVAQILKK